jgi:hypothetical protein
LTEAVVVRHFRATRGRDVLGLHTTSLDNTSKFGTVEIDNHGPDSTPAEINERAARGWYDELRQRGFRPLLWDSNGSGGYHLDLLLAGPVETARLFWFLHALVSDHARRGLSARPETFPKRPRLDPRPDGRGCCGNWVRVIGRHHTREHWAKVWDGSRWLAGEQAVEFILGLDGDPAELLPEVPASQPPAVVTPRPAPLSPARRQPRSRGGNLAARIAAYLARLPNLAEGQGRDDVGYQFATWLVRDLALADDIALQWLQQWDQHNSPPKGEERLRVILADAHQYGRHAVGSGLSSQPRRDRHGHIIVTHTFEV